MRRYMTALLCALLLATMMVARLVAQAQTAQSVLQTAAKAMGTDTVRCLTYTSTRRLRGDRGPGFQSGG